MLLIAGAVYVWMTRDNSRPAESHGPAADPAVKADAPTFAGVGLEGKKVVYVLDRGDATAAFFPALRNLTINSVKSLGPTGKFQVVLWDNGGVDAFPALIPGFASAEQIDKLGKWFDAVNTGRATEALPALKQAMAGSPDVCILATGKSLNLADGFADAVLAVRPPRTTVHAFTLGETAPDDPLRKIAKDSGGKFKALSGNDLNAGG